MGLRARRRARAPRRRGGRRARRARRDALVRRGRAGGGRDRARRARAVRARAPRRARQAHQPRRRGLLLHEAADDDVGRDASGRVLRRRGAALDLRARGAAAGARRVRRGLGARPRRVLPEDGRGVPVRRRARRVGAAVRAAEGLHDRRVLLEPEPVRARGRGAAGAGLDLGRLRRRGAQGRRARGLHGRGVRHMAGDGARVPRDRGRGRRRRGLRRPAAGRPRRARGARTPARVAARRGAHAHQRQVAHRHRCDRLPHGRGRDGGAVRALGRAVLPLDRGLRVGLRAAAARRGGREHRADRRVGGVQPHRAAARGLGARAHPDRRRGAGERGAARARGPDPTRGGGERRLPRPVAAAGERRGLPGGRRGRRARALAGRPALRVAVRDADEPGPEDRRRPAGAGLRQLRERLAARERVAARARGLPAHAVAGVGDRRRGAPRGARLARGMAAVAPPAGAARLARGALGLRAGRALARGLRAVPRVPDRALARALVRELERARDPRPRGVRRPRELRAAPRPRRALPHQPARHGVLRAARGPGRAAVRARRGAPDEREGARHRLLPRGVVPAERAGGRGRGGAVALGVRRRHGLASTRC